VKIFDKYVIIIIILFGKFTYIKGPSAKVNVSNW
jgi:hypothetical protein